MPQGFCFDHLSMDEMYNHRWSETGITEAPTAIDDDSIWDHLFD